MSQPDTRAAFEAWCRKEQGYLYKDEAEPGTPQEDKWLGFQAGAAHAVSAQSAQVEQGELPPLPEMTYLGGDEAYGDRVDGYTADQMRKYGQACAEAARQPAPALPVKTWQERVEESYSEVLDANELSSFNAALAEIADLRAALAATNRSQP